MARPAPEPAKRGALPPGNAGFLWDSIKTTQTGPISNKKWLRAPLVVTQFRNDQKRASPAPSYPASATSCCQPSPQSHTDNPAPRSSLTPHPRPTHQQPPQHRCPPAVPHRTLPTHFHPHEHARPQRSPTRMPPRRTIVAAYTIAVLATVAPANGMRHVFEGTCHRSPVPADEMLRHLTIPQPS